MSGFSCLPIQYCCVSSAAPPNASAVCRKRSIGTSTGNALNYDADSIVYIHYQRCIVPIAKNSSARVVEAPRVCRTAPLGLCLKPSAAIGESIEDQFVGPASQVLILLPQHHYMRLFSVLYCKMLRRCFCSRPRTLACMAPVTVTGCSWLSEAIESRSKAAVRAAYGRLVDASELARFGHHKQWASNICCCLHTKARTMS